ncbi:MAG: TetM/TetW/TetO/TetS family tetracycline resistance ribosomal protection protein [Gorillibacterium sp.]|nr:TetM/TetW/TetO/TetS family tetracycline resistance ribosomal protection protein [Gorillibacterium sp.]
MTSKQQAMRNVGIFAHVDAGKTTTTEQILFLSGAIRSLGSVDTGTTQTDSLEVERERGISVRSAMTRFTWKDVTVNLVDTPGHVDFLSEVERSLRVMDGAVLIVSAVEGVQAQTEVIWQALQQMQIPTLLYINKMDRIGADALAVLEQARRFLSVNVTPIQAPLGVEAAFVGATNLLSNRGRDNPESEPYRSLLVEAAAERDDELMQRYLDEGDLSVAELATVVPNMVEQSQLVPVLFGASNRGLGVAELMDAITLLLPPPAGDPKAPVAGVVFKLEKDPTMGRIAYVRMYNGIIRNRDALHNHTRGLEEKVTQIRRVDGPKSEDIGVLEAGDIAAVYGLGRARIGDILGSPEGIPGVTRLAVPLLTVQVHWRNEADYPAVVAAFQELADEDPLLELQWITDQRELHLKVMGPIQIEILMQIVKSRYNLDITFGDPSVIYKETPKKAGEGFIAYTMPKPCWAILRFSIEPGERGSGLVYSAQVRPEHLLERYQNEVERRVPEALQQGLFGWEVTDLKVTLVQGQHHVWHTHPLDFVVSTPMGIMDGLVNTGVKLLEPILNFRLSVPEEFGGKLMNELMVMRAEFDSPVIHTGRMEMVGLLPVATSLDFPARLGSMTKGRGTLSTSFAGYQDCPPDVHVERERRGVNPLDQAKYILAARSALS